MTLSISVRAVERDVARQQAKVDRLRHEASCLDEGTPAHQTAVTRLHWAECHLNADTKLLAWMKRRLALFRALNIERLMDWPQVIG
jgi:hypothetical protein